MQAQTQRYHSQRIERKTEKVTSHAAGAVIVRPDGVVAWRSSANDDAAADQALELAMLIGRQRAENK